jgi:type I restriction enzyme S subunit
VSSGEVSNCRIRDTAEKITRVGLDNSNAKIYPKGTVLIAMIGEGKTRGQSAILGVEASTNQNSAALVFDVPLVEPEYVWFWALGEYEKNRNVGRGGNQPALNGAKVRALPLPLAPREEQLEIVRRVKLLFAYADRLEARYATARRQVENLTPALLAKAFRGELVPQDPTDEPAVVLLERIRAARAAEASKPKHNKTGTRAKKTQKAEVNMLSRKDIQGDHLTTILKERGPLTAETLWSASQLDIDDFYDQLKAEEDRGLLLERRGKTSSETRLLEAA